MIKQLSLSLITGLLGSMLFGIANNYFYVRPIAVVKIDEVIADHLKKYGSQDLSEAARKKVSEQFAMALDVVIKRISKEQRVTLLVAPAVLSSAPDYTDFVKNEVEKAIHDN